MSCLIAPLVVVFVVNFGSTPTMLACTPSGERAQTVGLGMRTNRDRSFDFSAGDMCFTTRDTVLVADQNRLVEADVNTGVFLRCIDVTCKGFKVVVPCGWPHEARALSGPLVTSWSPSPVFRNVARSCRGRQWRRANTRWRRRDYPASTMRRSWAGVVWLRPRSQRHTQQSARALFYVYFICHCC